jgi:uncharacterized protein (DUF362 family)
VWKTQVFPLWVTNTVQQVGIDFIHRMRVGLMTAKVAIQKTTNIDDPVGLRKQFNQLLGAIAPHLPRKHISTILIKVNMCYIKGPETGITVDPALVHWLCEWFCEHFDVTRIYVAEADATHLDATLAFKVLGWHEAFSDMSRVSLLNLSKDQRVKVEYKGRHFKDREMSEKFMGSDLLVSFAKLKTHSMQGITCVMKNQFGALPEKLKILYHSHLDEAIVDAVRIRPPDLCVVDGLIGHQGPGPVGGLPIVAGLLVAGTDAVATDHACANLMGIDPMRVPHIRLAKKENVGTTVYEVAGTPISEARLKFMTIPLWRKSMQFVKEGIRKTSRQVSG